MINFIKRALFIYVAIFFLVMGTAFLIGVYKNNNLFSLKLSCKTNPSAPYTDKYYFNRDMTFAKRTSNNKSVNDESFNINSISDSEYKLRGVSSEKLFILKQQSPLTWNLYYYQDYGTNPYTYMKCRSS